MSKTTIILIIIGLFVLGTAAWGYSKWNAYAPTEYVEETTENGTTTENTVNTETGTSTPGAPSYTMADVAKHNSASSCFTVISGKVYDLTLWVNMHPGGKSAILSLCGIDGTAKFTAKHGGQEKQMTTLTRFYIGKLVSGSNQTSTSPSGSNSNTDVSGSIPSGTMCTMDAFQCPNGEWVGRSGPNCQFVCN